MKLGWPRLLRRRSHVAGRQPCARAAATVARRRAPAGRRHDSESESMIPPAQPPPLAGSLRFIKIFRRGLPGVPTVHRPRTPAEFAGGWAGPPRKLTLARVTVNYLCTTIFNSSLCFTPRTAHWRNAFKLLLFAAVFARAQCTELKAAAQNKYARMISSELRLPV